MKISVKIKHACTSIVRTKVMLKLWIFIGIVAISVAPVAAANEVVFKLKPGQCIAIHQGKSCYVDVDLRWQAQDEGEYCLYSSQQTEPLKCWSQSDHGKFEREIVARKNVLFRLRETKSGGIVISRELEMAWIYKRNAKARSSWRMF